MSKAFTREADNDDEFAPIPPRSALPPGVKNYLTTDGAQRLREEVARLLEHERPALAAEDDPASVRRRQLLDQRVQWLVESLQAAVVIDPATQPHDQVRFGATVQVRSQSGVESTYRIVGVDEADVDRGWISWLSPIAKAMVNARVGQQVRVRLPDGWEELEVLQIGY